MRKVRRKKKRRLHVKIFLGKIELQKVENKASFLAVYFILNWILLFFIYFLFPEVNTNAIKINVRKVKNAFLNVISLKR